METDKKDSNINLLDNSIAEINLSSRNFNRPIAFNLKFDLCNNHKYLHLIYVRNLEKTYSVINVTYSSTTSDKPVTWSVMKSLNEILDFVKEMNNRELNKEASQKKDNLREIIKRLEKDVESKEIFEIFIEFANKISKDYENISKKSNFLEFFEISDFSFVSLEKGVKYKEGFINKKKLNKVMNYSLFDAVFCCKLLQYKSYTKKWFVIKDDMMFYFENNNMFAKDIIWYDQDILLQNSFDYKDVPTITVINSARVLTLKFLNEIELHIWEEELNNKIHAFKRQHFKYNSFSSQKKLCFSKYFIDASSYYSHFYHKISKAKSTIFITGWWISPELALIRPISIDKVVDDRNKSPYILKNLLLQKANEGVKIYIIVYKEFSLVVEINSAHTKEVFRNLHPNIKFVRYPKGKTELFWSSHEKIVVIDQKEGYVGGLDLCWGRYDNHSHCLYEKSEKEKDDLLWPGIDYNNVRIKDFENLQDVVPESVDRRIHQRLPWHDIHCYLKGPIISDLSKHFIQKWGFAKRTNNNLLTNDNHLYNKRQSLIEDENEHQGNIEVKRTKTIIISQQQQNNLGQSMIIKKNQSFLVNNQSSDKKNLFHGLKKTVKNAFKPDNDEDIDLKIVNSNQNPDLNYNLSCQLIRSASTWSMGLEVEEKSIYEAYISLIERAENYIIIENQFFLSKSYTVDEEKYVEESYISNIIALKIRQKIEKSYEKGRKLRVIIIIPCLPGFTGEIESDHTLQILVKFHYSTISRNKGFSLIESLYKVMGEKYKDYLSIVTLRSHGVNPYTSQPSTEMIYVHSKLMLIDDKYALIGSANINDRSLLGWRDSEIAVVISEGNKIEIQMNNSKVEVSEFVYNMRVELLSEHMGLNDKDSKEVLKDPLSDEFFEYFKEIAETNGKIYSKVFPYIYPANHLKTLKDVVKAKQEKDFSKINELYNEYSPLIKGNIMEFQQGFLENEDLDVKSIREIFMPIKNYL